MNKKNERIIKTALQYSKWMSKFICWVWAIYRFTALFTAAFVPEAAEAMASTLYNLDWIMLVNEGTYLINSLGEKYIYSDRFIFKWLETGGFKQLISRAGALNKQRDEEIVEEVEDDIAEEEAVENEEPQG